MIEIEFYECNQSHRVQKVHKLVDEVVVLGSSLVLQLLDSRGSCVQLLKEVLLLSCGLVFD